MYLNPAMTGMFDGKYRLHTQYRTQWSAVATKPYVTTGASFDMPVKKYGVGFQVLNYRAGVGNYNAFSALVSGAYDVVLDLEKNHHLAMGMQAGVEQKSFNPDKLSFGSQYTFDNGGGFDMSMPNGEAFSRTNIMMFDVNAGALYYYSKDNSRINPFVGVSAFHLNNPKESFYITANKLPVRYYVHGGVKVNVNEKVQLLPKFIIMQQKNVTEVTTSLILQYYMMGSQTYLLSGFTYRSKDAAIVEFGIKKEKYIARLSYDINTSSLKDASQYRGGLELAFTYIARRSKPNPLANCPRLQ
jgi:type IX secretion system PorP/SprF family membrane protein